LGSLEEFTSSLCPEDLFWAARALGTPAGNHSRSADIPLALDVALGAVDRPRAMVLLCDAYGCVSHGTALFESSGVEDQR